MSAIRPLAACLFLALTGQAATAQITPEDLKKQIDARTDTLSGFQQLLEDPDPRRSLAAMEGMLASGDPNVEHMAMEFGLTNPDPMIRTAALNAYMAKLPPIAVDFDASALPDEQLEQLAKILRATGGSIGPDKKGSFSFQAGPFNEGQGCFPHASSSRVCAMRVGTGSLSLYFSGTNVSGRWVNLHADETGQLKGGISLNYGSEPDIALPLAVRLLN